MVLGRRPSGVPTVMAEFRSSELSDEILVHTDKQQYYPGEDVTGQVTLSLANPLEIDTINLRLSGYEHAEFYFDDTRVVTTYGPNGTVNRTTVSVQNHTSETNTIYGREYVLYACHSTLAPGVYGFSFKFKLKQNLPGSFWYNKTGNDESQAEVDYQLKAEIFVPGSTEPKFSLSHQFVVVQPLEGEVMSSETYQEANVSFLYCIPRGQVSLSAAVDKNVYCPGESIMLSLIVDNSKSTVNLPRFSLKLQRVVSLCSQGKTNYKVTTVVKSSIEGVPKGERAERLMAVNLPKETEPSTNGLLVKCYYELLVELQVPWSPNVTTKTPVQVYATPLYSAPFASPTGWSVKIFPTVDLATLTYKTDTNLHPYMV